MAPYLFAIFVVAIVAAGIYAWKQEKKRRQALRTWCARHGWTLVGHSMQGWHQDYPGIKLFDRGRGREGDNIITGRFRGRPVTLLDYEYVTGSGKNRTTHRYGVVIMDVGHPVIPLQIRREHLLDRVGEFLGAGDIDFESAEFSRTFHVSSSDRKWAFDVIHARTMEYLLEAEAFNIEFGFGEVVIYKQGRSAPAEYEAQVEMAHRLITLIPDYVVKQMKGE